MFQFFGIPFVLVGLYLIIGRFWVDAAQRKRAFYGVTTSRIIFVSGLTAQKVKTLSLFSLSEVSLTLSQNGVGTISFGRGFPLAATWSWWPGMEMFASPSFDQIDDAQMVYRLICDAQENTDF